LSIGEKVFLRLKWFLTICLCCWCILAYGQGKVEGKVTDVLTDEPIEGVIVTILGTGKLATTNANGTYSIQANGFPLTIEFKKGGFISETRDVSAATSDYNISLLPDTESLSEVVLVGTRFQPRSIADSPVPIDNIEANDLKRVGHYDLDMMMMYSIPSFNTSNQTVSDATAHMNPAGLRGLGPSRTLFLINGKRKNSSALVYINDTPSKGDVGIDLKSIPISAIERIEVLRDGASAQYGSDAIAGVVNIILKEDKEYAEVNSLGGMYQEGDGETFYIDANAGFEVGSAGYVNVSAIYQNQSHTNRPGDFTGYDSIIGIPNTEGAELEQFPNGGMIVGQPEMMFNSISYNAQFGLNNEIDLYSFGTLTNRRGRSFALYRLPAWSRAFADPDNILGTDGYLPNFQTVIKDDYLTVGVRGEKRGWHFDMSTSTGGNHIQYTIGNTVNPSLGLGSPTQFDAGGYEFTQVVNNLDVSRNLNSINIAFGAEFRVENFIAHAGQEESYRGAGAQSFPGIRRADEVDKKRFNVSFYADLEKSFGDRLLLSLAGRFEDYSDFGDKVTGKFSTRFKLIEDLLNLRASVSTGFRAPSLHQTHFSSVQTILVGSEVTQQGTFSNESTVIKALQVPSLKEETSRYFGAGFTLTPDKNMFLTADCYLLRVDDRIVFTGTLTNPDSTTLVGSILNDFDISGMKFFTNAIDTKTTGVDIVFGYDNIRLGGGNLNTSLAANFNKTEIVGSLNTPDILANQGNTLFDRKERSRVESARPEDKVILQLRYTVANWQINLNNTRFGKVTWRHASVPANDQTFEAKILTDLSIGYTFGSNITLLLGANNLLDVYPDEIDPGNDPVTNLIGRFKYPWDVNQFGFNGRFYFGRLKVKI